MRVDRLNQLADALENGLPNVKFDIGRWRGKDLDCGTVACIAGHAAILGGYPDGGYYNSSRAFKDAVDWLELPSGTAWALFEPDEILADAERRHALTGPKAAPVVRHLALTGKVDWSVARKEGDGE